MLFGILIGNMRKEYNVPIQELSRGICTISMLRQFETGNREPEKLVADALFQRLGKSVDKYEIMLDLDEYRLASRRAEIGRLLSENRLPAVKRKIAEYEKAVEKENTLHMQYLSLVRAEVLRRENTDLDKQIINISQGLNLTFSKELQDVGMIEYLYQHRLSLIEMFLCQRYTVLIGMKGDIHKAYDWHCAILRYLESKTGVGKEIEYDVCDVRKIYPFSAYWMAEYLNSQHRYEEAIPLIQKSFEMLSVDMTQLALFLRFGELESRVMENMKSESDELKNGCLKLIRNMDKCSYELWDDWYPTYREQYIHCVNEVIKQRRILRNWTEEDLAFEICDSRAIKRIESMNHIPQKKIKLALLNKLGISTEKYDGGINTKDYNDFKLYEKMLECYNVGDYNQARIYFLELSQKINSNDISNNQFFSYWNSQLNWKHNIYSDEIYFDKIWGALNKSFPINNAQMNIDYDLFEHERNMITDLFWWKEHRYSQYADQIVSIQFLELKKRNIKQYMFREFYGSVLYGIALSKLTKGKIIESGKIVKYGLTQARLNHTDSAIGRLYFLKYRIEKSKSEKRKTRSASLNSTLCIIYAIEKYYEKNNRVIQFIKNQLPDVEDIISDLDDMD